MGDERKDPEDCRMAGTHRPLRHREGRLVRRLRTLANDDVAGNNVVGYRTASRVPRPWVYLRSCARVRGLGD